MEGTRTTEIDNLWKFVCSIDWTEKWLLGLLAVHAASFGLTYLLRQKGTPQIAHFSVLLLLVWCAEYINELAAKNWRHQYFDSRGLFISVVFSMPILCNCLIIVVPAFEAVSHQIDPSWWTNLQFGYFPFHLMFDNLFIKGCDDVAV